jgi:hypothetical protein
MKRIYDTISPYLTRDRIILATLVICLLFALTCNNSQKNRIIEEKNNELTRWRDAEGNEHARVLVLEKEKVFLMKEVDSISQVLGIKPKQVVKYVKGDLLIDTVLRDTGKLVVLVDTVYKNGKLDTVKHITYNDPPHLSIDATDDSIKVRLNAQINTVEYFKRKKVLGLAIGKKTYYEDISTNNPYISITNASSSKAAPKKKLHISPSAGVGLYYDPLLKRAGAGVIGGITITRN